jgi:hypothetical protein
MFYMIKDSKYMFPFPTCTKCSSKNKVLNILKRQTRRIVFLNDSRLNKATEHCMWGALVGMLIFYFILWKKTLRNHLALNTACEGH